MPLMNNDASSNGFHLIGISADQNIYNAVKSLINASVTDISINKAFVALPSDLPNTTDNITDISIAYFNTVQYTSSTNYYSSQSAITGVTTASHFPTETFKKSDWGRIGTANPSDLLQSGTPISFATGAWVHLSNGGNWPAAAADTGLKLRQYISNGNAYLSITPGADFPSGQYIQQIFAYFVNNHAGYLVSPRPSATTNTGYGDDIGSTPYYDDPTNAQPQLIGTILTAPDPPYWGGASGPPSGYYWSNGSNYADWNNWNYATGGTSTHQIAQKWFSAGILGNLISGNKLELGILSYLPSQDGLTSTERDILAYVYPCFELKPNVEYIFAKQKTNAPGWGESEGTPTSPNNLNIDFTPGSNALNTIVKTVTLSGSGSSADTDQIIDYRHANSNLTILND